MYSLPVVFAGLAPDYLLFAYLRATHTLLVRLHFANSFSLDWLLFYYQRCYSFAPPFLFWLFISCLGVKDIAPLCFYLLLA
jgi:hypothetical protein